MSWEVMLCTLKGIGLILSYSAGIVLIVVAIGACALGLVWVVGKAGGGVILEMKGRTALAILLAVAIPLLILGGYSVGQEVCANGFVATLEKMFSKK